MGQATAASNLLQLHHNFRWILFSNHADPVAGFLQRYLRRRLLSACIARSATRCVAETTQSASPGDERDDDEGMMNRVVNWLPRAWQRVNEFLGSRGTTTDVSIGVSVLISLSTRNLNALYTVSQIKRGHFSFRHNFYSC